MNIARQMADAARRLGDLGIERPERVVGLLMQRVLNCDHAGLLVRSGENLPAEQEEKFRALIARAETEPVFRILGSREFHGLELTLSAATLEPRDDTEALIEGVVDAVSDVAAPLRFADLGTGSGAIALALLSEFHDAKAVLSDFDPEALATARGNAARHKFLDRCAFVCGDWCEPLDGLFDFIVSNPPYIASAVIDELSADVRDFDPRLALDGGSDGLDAYRAILRDAAACLKPGGFLALECGFDQIVLMEELAATLGWDVRAWHRDLSGHNRAVILRPANRRETLAV